MSGPGRVARVARFLLPLAGAGLATALCACSVPVANGLEEGDANKIVLALDRAGVHADKEADPAAEGRYRVNVAREDAAASLAAMREEELPRPRARGLLDAVDKGSLVVSQATEHAQLVGAMAGELQRTLEDVDGVLAARVHLNVPPSDALAAGPRPKPTASVLLEHRGATSPITPDSVQRLVAGGVPGLAPADVAVIALPRAARAQSQTELAQVGPITVARGSVHRLQAALALLIVLVAIFAAGMLGLYTRLSRLRSDAQRASLLSK